jgi:hypothetical protein
MFHACAARFDVTENLENFLDFGVNKQGLKLIWKIYSFTKSQNQMTSEKKDLLQQCAIWARQKNLAS